MEGDDFPSLDTVRLVIFGLDSEDGLVVLLEKEVSNTWKQTSVIEM